MRRRPALRTNTLTINQPTSSLPAGVPDLALLTEKAAGTGSVIIYQPYLDPSQRSQLDAAAMPLDISFNTQATTREYELSLPCISIRGDRPGDDVFWGLYPAEFEMKSRHELPVLCHGGGKRPGQKVRTPIFTTR